MQVERASAGASLIDVLDRALDKGIVIDAWVRLSLIGIDLIRVEARVVVASIETYLHHSEALGAARTAARPEPHRPASLAESLGTSQKSGSPLPVLPPAFRDRRARPRSPHSA
jgi:hypothetical protein